MHINLYIEVIMIILFRTIFPLYLEKHKHHKVLKLRTLYVIKLQREAKRYVIMFILNNEFLNGFDYVHINIKVIAIIITQYAYISF